jgi:hypothetical protein
MSSVEQRSEMAAKIEFMRNRLHEIQAQLDQAAAEQNWSVYDSLNKERKQLATEYVMLNPNISEEARMSLLKDEADSLTKKLHSKSQ